MHTELGYHQCLDLLATSSVGRVAFCTPQGPHLVPVNFTVVDESIIMRTTPYSALGTHGWNGLLAFEVDRLDEANHTGWSVVARGKGEMIRDRAELGLIRGFHDPEPWAGGATRYLYLRLRWDDLTGRRVGS